MDKRPLISICIPTYNRAQYLKQTLESYVGNSSFDDKVEIVISDNASTDETQAIGENYASRYPNIKYFRNDENLSDSNFCLALDRGTGDYLKLMNDNVVFTSSGLRYVKDRLLDFYNNKQPVFFTNHRLFVRRELDTFMCEKFEDLVVNLSYLVTAIHVFGAWREGCCALCTGNYCVTLPMPNKKRSGYNWFQVHVTNYYLILKPYIDKGLVSEKSLYIEKKIYLWGLRPFIVISYLYNIIPEYQFDMSNTTRILWHHFKGVPLFYTLMLTLPIWGGVMVLKFFVKRLFKLFFHRKTLYNI